MILRKLRQINQEQRGFSLIEMILVIAITGFIAVGAAMATVQVMSQAPRNADYNAASSQVANTIHWISRDAQMAQTVETEGESGFPLTLSWTEWDNSEYQVVYTLENSTFHRSYSVDGGEPTVNFISEYISEDAELTSCDYTDSILTLRITAAIGQGINAVQVSRLRDIAPRPGI